MFDTLRNNSKIIVYIVVVAFVVTGAFMGYGAYLNNSSSSSASESANSPYIATVNGNNITTQEFYQVLQNQIAQNPQLDNSQVIPVKLYVLNSMIERELLLQQAQKMGIEAEVTNQDVDDIIEDILKNNEMEKNELVANLEEQGYTFNQFKDDIRKSLEQRDLMQQTMEQSYSNVEVTEAEIKNQYKKENEDKEASGEDYEKAKSEIKDELLNQKQNESFANWMEKIKTEADITIHDPVLSGVNALQNENYEKAIERLNEAIENSPAPQLYHYLASAYNGTEQTEKALEIYEKATEKYPDNWDLLVSLGQLYQNMEKKDEAITTYKKASAAAGKEDFMAHYQLYMAFSELEATEEAEKEMELINKIQQEQAEQRQKQLEQQQNQKETEEAGDNNDESNKTANSEAEDTSTNSNDEVE